MRTLIEEVETEKTPEILVARLATERSPILLHSALRQSGADRFSFVSANPFASLEARGSECRLRQTGHETIRYGNPWHVLDQLARTYELLEECDKPFPLGGIFGYWGYELNRALSHKLASKALRNPETPDLAVGCYDSLCVFDHGLNKCFVVSTGMLPDGSRSACLAEEKLDWWKSQLSARNSVDAAIRAPAQSKAKGLRSNLSRDEFESKIRRAKEYIRAGDVYQINLSQRLELPFSGDLFQFYRSFMEISPAPYGAYLGFHPLHIASASPESFLRMSGRHVRTRPIKGTRPRSANPQRDAQLAFELQSSSKELAELVMITDLLRNDLGRICEFGSVTVPDLVRLERFPQVQHLVSTVEGTLKSGLSHVQAMSACFPGGSITGTPKLRAMQIIDELEPIARGPYTGAIGYLGFNQESHLNIAIRTAYQVGDQLYFHSGAGIVADSDPAAEYEETLAKAAGFLGTLGEPGGSSLESRSGGSAVRKPRPSVADHERLP